MELLSLCGFSRRWRNECQFVFEIFKCSEHEHDCSSDEFKSLENQRDSGPCSILRGKRFCIKTSMQFKSGYKFMALAVREQCFAQSMSVCSLVLNKVVGQMRASMFLCSMFKPATVFCPIIVMDQYNKVVQTLSLSNG